MNTGIIGLWLIVTTLVWLVGVASVVVLGLGNMDGDRRNGCSGRGCRRDAGWHGSDTTPRRAEPVRGFLPGWRK